MPALRNRVDQSRSTIVTIVLLLASFHSTLALLPIPLSSPSRSSLSSLQRGRSFHPGVRRRPSSHLGGWLDNFLPRPVDDESYRRADEERRSQFPEQYPATYELISDPLRGDCTPEGALVRPLLKQTQLESRPLRLAFDASQHGWSASAFHGRVDGLGAAIVLTEAVDGQIVGGYNPKGWASMGGARPSVAAFLFYEKDGDGTFQKLQKIGGGGLACSSDEPNSGIAFGPDGLVVSLQPGREKMASSKLGTYFDRGPEDLSSLLYKSGGTTQLKELKVLVGVYGNDEEIPYSGAVLDMTSG